LTRFSRTAALEFRRTHLTQQIQFNRTLGSGNNFVAYADAIGELAGALCVLEWKTTSTQYPEEPAGIPALDQQLGGVLT